MQTAYLNGKPISPAEALALRGGPDGRNPPKGTYRAATGEPVKLHHFRNGEQPDRFERFSESRSPRGLTYNHDEEDYLD